MTFPDKLKNPERMMLIPSGSYQMGSETGYAEESPVHTVHVNAFYMDKYLVTNREYRAFCDETGTAYPQDPYWSEYPCYFDNYPDYPVVNVSLPDAKAYAAWAGKRLPHEEEWEYAARGGKNGPYAWGEEIPDGKKANFADRCSDYEWRDFRHNDGYRYTSPVGTYEPNGYGLYDMCGNVYEWCDDWFFRYDDTVKDNRMQRDNGWGVNAICRGGCFYSDAFGLRVTLRHQAQGGGAQSFIGFRCVRDALDDGSLCPLPPLPPEEVSPEPAPDVLKRVQEHGSVSLNPDFQLCIGCGTSEVISEQTAQEVAALGATSIELYLTWESIEAKGKEQWDFSVWDENIRIMQKFGVKFLPFLIAGPAYSLPEWFRKSDDFRGLQCLEHDMESKVQSIWDPRFYPYIERFLAKVAERYGKSDVLEGVMVGVSGDFGEGIFPVWYGGWPTQIPGMYHSHPGYWCGDPCAKRHFIHYCKEHFATLENLNLRWGTHFYSWELLEFPQVECAPFPEGFRLDEQVQAGIYQAKTPEQRLRWMDFIDWYRYSMNEYIDFWMKTARKYFPDLPLYLCTGGDGAQMHGSQFTMQAKTCAKYGGGIRITNEASKYSQNVYLTNLTAAACHFYGSYSSFEPAGAVNERGVVCRIFNAFSTGSHLHFYTPNITSREITLQKYLENAHYLRPAVPTRDIGVMIPDVSVVLQCHGAQTMGIQGNITAKFEILRDYTDFSMIDDYSIADGILETFKMVILPWGDYYRRATIEKLREFVENGGLLVGLRLEKMVCIEDNTDVLSEFFGEQDQCRPIGKGRTLNTAVTLPGLIDDPRSCIGTPFIDYPADHEAQWYQEHLFDRINVFAQEDVYIPDGVIDGIYTAEVDGEIYCLNNTSCDLTAHITTRDHVQQEIPMPANVIKEI